VEPRLGNPQYNYRASRSKPCATGAIHATRDSVPAAVVNQTNKTKAKTVGVYGKVAYRMNGGPNEYNNWGGKLDAETHGQWIKLHVDVYPNRSERRIKRFGHQLRCTVATKRFRHRRSGNQVRR